MDLLHLLLKLLALLINLVHFRKIGFLLLLQDVYIPQRVVLYVVGLSGESLIYLLYFHL